MLVFLLSGAQLGELNRGRMIGCETARNETGEVGDEVGSRQIWREQSGRLRFCGGRDEQIDGFIDRKKVAARSGIGDGERTSRGELACKDFADTTAACENIAEPQDSALRSEDNLLSHALGGTHDGGRCDRLVGGEKNDARVICYSSRNHCFSCEDIVFDGSEGLLFKQGNVLVCGGVKDKTRTVQGEDFIEQRTICDAAKIENCAGRMRKISEVALKFVEAIFRGFKKDELRAFAGESKSERSADRPSSAGDQDRLFDK